MAATIPPWLEDHCCRLKAMDCQITNLNLNIRKLNSACLEALMEALKGNETIQNINLTSALALLSEEEMFPLTHSVLPNHPSLKILHLSYNRLQNGCALATALETNRTLVELHVDHNHLNTQSALFFAQTLYCNNTLEVLQLNSNKIGDQGGAAIVKALESNSTMRELKISNNRLGTQTALALLDMLRTNTSLMHLELDRNPLIPVHDSERIQFLVRTNKAGRCLLQSVQATPSYLQKLLHNSDPSIVYYFLAQIPHLANMESTHIHQ